MDIPRPAKICSVSQRELLSGEEFYSVLTDDEGLLRRQDIAAEHWATPPEHCLGWWKTKVPENTAKKDNTLSNDSLLQLFDGLSFTNEKNDVRYVLTLLLLRRRLFRLEREETSETGEKIMFVTPLDGGIEYPVTVSMPNQERLEEIQQLLGERTQE
ncbi:MAG: hypothetical protein LBT89_00715 [Planctomycetaceae bacterium]|jgi:hypothetical protein|nr:hypothetical protein [Planctomycetaceae bacterium]